MGSETQTRKEVETRMWGGRLSGFHYDDHFTHATVLKETISSTTAAAGEEAWT